MADDFSAVAQRNVSEDEVDMEYHAMEDAEPLGPWIQDAVNDARRERNMTRYAVHDQKAPEAPEPSYEDMPPREESRPLGSATIENAGSSWGSAPIENAGSSWGSATIENAGSSWGQLP